jgi:hypothetical protein
MPEEAKKHGTFAGTLIGAVLVSLLSSGVLSGAVNWGTAEKAGEEAKKAVEEEAHDQAAAEAAKAEKAIAEYIKKQVEPRVLKSFEDVYTALDEMDEEIRACRVDLREATIMSETALRLAERSVGRRTVEREIERADAAEPKPAPKARKKKLLPIFNDYEQRKAD